MQKWMGGVVNGHFEAVDNPEGKTDMTGDGFGA